MIVEVIVGSGPTVGEGPFEVVERKGRGHPDTICDLLADHISYDLGHFYLRECGRVLHYNVDKALLVGGASSPAFGGGEIVEPAKLYLGDRAISRLDNGQVLDLESVIEESISRWLDQNLRFLRLGENLLWKNEIKEGAASLNDVEERNLANDTSVGVGFWPLSRLEQMTLALENHLNSPAFKVLHPESGEDVKVLSVRRGKSVETIVACAFVDRFITDAVEYEARKAAIHQNLADFAKSEYGQYLETSVILNALDDPSRGQDGLYLTVTGLSCESGDSGEVGRGNRVNGLISFLRPQTMEAWAGKNFKSHIGKIYSFAAENLARTVTSEIPEVKEAVILLVGKIGSPVDSPPYVFGDLKLREGAPDAIRAKAESVLKKAIAAGAVFGPESLFHERAGLKIEERDKAGI